MNQYRKKLLNAILYFARNTLYPCKTKIFKLLYYLDFNHFRQVGYPSIGLNYKAFKNGPLPLSFWIELKDGTVPADFKNHLELIKFNLKYEGVEFIAKQDPDLGVFTPREKKILAELVELYRTKNAAEMTEISHQENQPWDITHHTKGSNADIDYLLAIDDDSSLTKEEAAESLRSFYEVINNFNISAESY
jgi:uncharacterized phage-associated protein